MFLGDLFERREFVNARVVDENVNPAKAFFVSAKRRSMSACLATSACTAMALPPCAVISLTPCPPRFCWKRS